MNLLYYCPNYSLWLHSSKHNVFERLTNARIDFFSIHLQVNKSDSTCHFSELQGQKICEQKLMLRFHATCWIDFSIVLFLIGCNKCVKACIVAYLLHLHDYIPHRWPASTLYGTTGLAAWGRVKYYSTSYEIFYFLKQRHFDFVPRTSNSQILVFFNSDFILNWCSL